MFTFCAKVMKTFVADKPYGFFFSILIEFRNFVSAKMPYTI